jgi:hypothetical protein
MINKIIYMKFQNVQRHARSLVSPVNVKLEIPMFCIPKHAAHAHGLSDSSIIHNESKWTLMPSFTMCRNVHDPLHCQSLENDRGAKIL